MMRANFHTHTVYCDGSNTPAELARAALDLGFAALGFSGHVDPDCGMPPAGEARYRREIRALQAELAGQLEIFCGVEQDYCCGRVDPWYDYAIGSVHYIPKNGELLCVDWSADRTADHIRDHYAGDPYAYAADYYALEGAVLEVTGGVIVGHFDLLTKFDEGGTTFRPTEARYRAAVLDALDRLCEHKPVFELNTGALGRGYRTTPYPAFWILEELHRRDCPIMITSDCHDAAKLTVGYDLAVRLALEAGYTHQVRLTRNGFAELDF